MTIFYWLLKDAVVCIYVTIFHWFLKENKNLYMSLHYHTGAILYFRMDLKILALMFALFAAYDCNPIDRNGKKLIAITDPCLTTGFLFIHIDASISTILVLILFSNFSRQHDSHG